MELAFAAPLGRKFAADALSLTLAPPPRRPGPSRPPDGRPSRGVTLRPGTHGVGDGSPGAAGPSVLVTRVRTETCPEGRSYTAQHKRLSSRLGVFRLLVPCVHVTKARRVHRVICVQARATQRTEDRPSRRPSIKGVGGHGPFSGRERAVRGGVRVSERRVFSLPSFLLLQPQYFSVDVSFCDMLSVKKIDLLPSPRKTGQSRRVL